VFLFITYGKTRATPTTMSIEMNCEVEIHPPNTVPRAASPR
jgi:hypothetical protein